MKSLYRRSSAAWTASGDAGGSMAFSSWEIGIDEMTWSHGNSVRVPSLASAITATALPPSWRMPTTRVFISTVQPLASTFSVHRSHIIPGPYLGYWNSSMREVISFWFRFGVSALITAPVNDRFLIRWAAKSAGSWSTGTPHSFSL